MQKFNRGQQLIKISGDNKKIVTYVRSLSKSQVMVINEDGFIEIAMIWELKRGEEYGSGSGDKANEQSGSENSSNPRKLIARAS